MNKLDLDYQNLLQDILDNGSSKETRSGKTLSVFGRQIRHKMSSGFPLLTTKKMYFKGIVTELIWFLRGDTNVKYLIENGCNIWNGDAIKNYEKHNGEIMAESFKAKEEIFTESMKYDEFAEEWGDLGPIYGKQWRNWGGFNKVPSGWEHGAIANFKEVPTFDQIADVINKLKTNPDDRGIIVSAWNVAELDQMTLRPCHNFFQFYTRELTHRESESLGHKYGNLNWEEQEKLVEPTRAISLMFNMRSNDVPLGLPFNIASYGLLLEIIAKEVNMIPDELVATLGDAHIYTNQIDAIKEQLTRESYPLPSLEIEKEVKWREGDCLPYYSIKDFTLTNYQSHQSIKIPLSN